MRAALEITADGVIIVPEIGGTVVDREQGTAAVLDNLKFAPPLTAELPTMARVPIVRVADLEPARAQLAAALSASVQVSFEGGIWMLPAPQLALFVTQSVNPHAIDYITEEKGSGEAQVIDGEAIGPDIGGGICQVSTTVYRAAYLAGIPITEWWPHQFRIPVYEYDGWPSGLDSSVLQPTEDASMSSWSSTALTLAGGSRSRGPRAGQKFQVLPDKEIVDPELEPGTIKQTSLADTGEELSDYRAVYDRNGNLLWERSFDTKFYPQGNIWAVSPDLRGKSPADPSRPLPPDESSATG